MVVGKHMHHAFGGVAASNNCGFDGYEIRSGMSVQVRRSSRVSRAESGSNDVRLFLFPVLLQDLKQLTAQRQCMEYWELQARNSPRQVSSNDWGASSPPPASLSSSPGSTSSMLSSSSSSSSGSPPRGRYAQATQQHSHASYQHHASSYRYGGYNRLSPRGRASPADKIFVTYGGQVVSFMEGVVNAPQIDCLPDMLAPL